MADREVMYFESAGDFRGWLEANHADHPGIMVKIAKKNSKVPAPSYEEAVRVGLCFGWIDSMTRRFDDDLFLQTFGPRSKRSGWSESNVIRVAELIESGEMTPAGQAEIDRAREDGRWPG